MKHQPLQDYLNGVAPKKAHVSLAFEQIEKIIGKKLPRSASIYPEWWANQKGGSRAPQWHAAGFRVEAVDLSRKPYAFREPEKQGNRHLYEEQ